jgi:methionyl-tRNA formyltransferase
MIEKPRIVFMGTPEFAVAHLKELINNDYQVVGVVTSPDKPAGRGKKIRKSAVKQFAEKLNIPVLQPKNLKSVEFNNDLQALQPDLQVVVAFRMLPEIVWRLPRLGTFNLHASLLPDYRGAAPINWAIINGETKTGVTTFFIDEKIDTGEIILQKEVEILPEDNASSLHDKLMIAGAGLVLKTVDLIAKGNVKTVAQPKIDLPKKAPKLRPENTRINWRQNGMKIHNFIRGLAMYPGAWTLLFLQENDEPKKFIIYKSRFEKTTHNEPAGQITAGKKTMKIAVTDGYIYPEIIKLQGKKQMDIRSFLNGIKNKDSLSFDI